MSKASVATEKLVERAAQKAMRGIDASQAEQEFSPLGVPTPLYWQIIVEPIKPKTTVGLIHLSEESQDIEKFKINVGKVMAIGRLALQGKTESGLDLSVEADRVKVGVFVQWFRHTGQEIKIVQPGQEDRLLWSLSCDDLMCIPADPYAIRFWV